jgi:hypothetical protein
MVTDENPSGKEDFLDSSSPVARADSADLASMKTGKSDIEPGVGRVFVARKPKGSSKLRSEYRRVGKYYKSAKRYQLERLRRRGVLERSLQGKTLAQIASELGVSLRTVKRDYAKVKPILKHKVSEKELAEGLRSEMQSFYAGLEGLSLAARHKVLTRFLEPYLRKARRKKRGVHEPQSTLMTLTVDLDAALQGGSALVLTPPNLTYSSKQLIMEVQLLAKGKLVRLGSITTTRSQTSS